MDKENESKIKDYLIDLFLSARPKSDAEEERTEKVRRFIKQQAKNYGRFVDTESDNWQTIIDGLICGWALKQICRKIQKDGYTSVIGNKSLARCMPAQLRSLSIDLYNRAKRSGSALWNVQAPIERMFEWSQKNPYDSEVTPFMDAVSLGFMRYDSPIETTDNNTAKKKNRD